MEKKALGRGLAALLSSGSGKPILEEALGVHKEHKGDGVIYIEISKIVPNRFQPRSDFNEERLQELIASIKEKGVVQPIIVRPAQDKYEIIAGERRFRAAKHLNLERVPAILKSVDDHEALVLAIVENIQRQELNPIEEAQAFQRLIQEFGLTQEEIAKTVSKDRATVANILRLLKLPPEVQKAIGSGGLSLGHGKVLLGLDNVAEQVKLTTLILSNSLSVRELENKIVQYKGVYKRKSTFAKDLKNANEDPYLQDVQHQLQHILGTKVKINVFKKRGKIEIEYYSADDRERILAILLKV